MSEIFDCFWKETESFKKRLIATRQRRLQKLDRWSRGLKELRRNVQCCQWVPFQSRYIQDKVETCWKKYKKSIVQTSVLEVSLKSLDPCTRHVNLLRPSHVTTWSLMKRCRNFVGKRQNFPTKKKLKTCFGTNSNWGPMFLFQTPKTSDPAKRPNGFPWKATW